MEVEFHDAGIHLPGLGLWLDPQRPVEAAWLSHAHADHARGVHGLVFSTPQTAELYAMRWPDAAGSRSIRCLEPGESVEYRGARLTALPAAHTLGSAQLLVEYRGERLVYTGDIKLMDPLCGWRTQIVPCTRLIMECTFGLPVFHFLSAEDAARRIAGFARECLESGELPVFFGYPLGRGQEIAHALARAGVPCMVHGAIARYIPVFEKAGYGFDGWKPYDARAVRGHALVVTTDLRAPLEAAHDRIRFALVSGWAMFASARAASGAHELIPYSGHAGFDELVEIVRRSGAARVDLVHGYTDAFASWLRALGVDARAHQQQAPAVAAP